MIAILLTSLLDIGLLWGVLLEFYFGFNRQFTYNDMYMDIILSSCIVLGLILVLASPVGDFIFGLISFTRKPIMRENKLLEPLIEEVSDEIIQEYKLSKLKINLRIKDCSEINMMAVGSRSIVITRGMYETYDAETLKACIAHEFGHLYHLDSKITGIIYGLLCVAVGIIGAGTVVYSFLFLMRERLNGILSLIGLIVGLLGIVILCGIMTVGGFYLILNCIIRFNNRSAEYASDTFASKLGYGKVLMKFLEEIKDDDLEKKNIMKRIFNTHPKAILRIGNLEKVMIKV